jgi:acyl-CoA oxidase
MKAALRLIIRSIEQQVLAVQLCADLRPKAVALVNAFGIPDECLSAPIALR